MKLARPLVLAASLLLATAAPRSSHAAPSVADLLKDRVAAAEKVYRTTLVMHQTGRTSTDAIYAWSVRWLDAALEAAPKNAKQIYADHLKRMQDLEAETKRMFTAGLLSSIDTDSATYYRIEAELWAARTRR